MRGVFNVVSKVVSEGEIKTHPVIAYRRRCVEIQIILRQRLNHIRMARACHNGDIHRHKRNRSL